MDFPFAHEDETDPNGFRSSVLHSVVMAKSAKHQATACCFAQTSSRPAKLPPSPPKSQTCTRTKQHCVFRMTDRKTIA